MYKNTDFDIIAHCDNVNKSWVESHGMISAIEENNAIVMYKANEKIYSSKFPIKTNVKINVGEFMDVEYDRLNPEICNINVHPKEKVDTDTIDDMYAFEYHHKIFSGEKLLTLVTFEELVQYNKEIESQIPRRGPSLTTRGTIVLEDEDSFIIEFYVKERILKKQFMKQDGIQYYIGKPVLLSYATNNPEFVVILPD